MQIDSTGKDFQKSQDVKEKLLTELLQKTDTNLTRTFNQIGYFIGLIEKNKEHLLVSKPSKIHETYPKYLSTFSLFNLQMKDFLFLETFLYQLLVFFDCL